MRDLCHCHIVTAAQMLMDVLLRPSINDVWLLTWTSHLDVMLRFLVCLQYGRGIFEKMIIYC